MREELTLRTISQSSDDSDGEDNMGRGALMGHTQSTSLVRPGE